MNNLAAAYGKIGNNEKALEYCKSSLEIKK